MNLHHPRMLLTALLVTGAATLTGITTIQDDRPTGAAQQQATPQYPVEIFRLKHANAENIREALRGIIMYRPDQGENFAVEASTNSLLLSLAPERMKVARPLIAELDSRESEQDQNAVEVFRLQHAELEDVFRLLTTIFPMSRFAVDPRNNGIIAQATPEQTQAIRALVAEVDTPDANDPSRQNQQLQLRIIWLIEGAEGLNRTPPADLQPVLNELNRYGVGQLSLVGQSILQTTPGAHFEHSFAATIDGRWNVEVNGTIEPVDGDAWRTVLGLGALEVYEPDMSAPQNRGRLQASGVQSRIEHATTIVTQDGRFVVLAMSPTDDMTSVFVVQITEIDN